MSFETFGKDKMEKRDKRIKRLVNNLITNGAGQKGTRLVIWNDNAQKYSDLGGWSTKVLADKIADLYDAAYADGFAGGQE